MTSRTSVAETMPYMSVVIICYNGAKTIGRAIASLQAQDYPAKQYEIIVVDDASTDATAEIVKAYPGVRYVRQAENGGIAAARSAGLAVVKGEIYVAFDSDCTADPQWLRQLSSGYANGEPAGVCGQLVSTEQPRGVIKKYMNATGTGPPPPLQADQPKKGLLSRIFGYVTSGMRRESVSDEPVVTVEEMYGANCSYPVSVLRTVGGWNKDLPGIEDRDMSARVHKAFPGRPFLSVRQATIMHDPDTNILQYMLRPFRRGPDNLAFHRMNNVLPPIFPYPFVFAATLITALFQPWLLVAALVLPQLLYYRWPYTAIRKHSVVHTLFPYLQLLEETMVVAGIMRGYYQLIVGNLRMAWNRASGAQSGALILCLFIIADWALSTLLLPDGIARAIISGAFLLFMPGYLAYRLITGSTADQSAYKVLAYSVGLSLLTIMGTGLLLNEFYTYTLDRPQPFVVGPLVAAIGGVTTALLLATSLLRRPFDIPALRRPPTQLLYTAGLVLAASILPLMAVGGAITLNNGGGNGLALTVFGIIGISMIVSIWRTSILSRYYPVILYSLTLALLLGTSMRGWNITGHDIIQEYQVFQLTLQHSAWHMNYYQDAYNACLSITILPTILQKLTGVRDPYIFELVFQLFFALIVPVLYLSLRRFAAKRIAFLAAVVFMTFPAFLVDITFLNRQETALLFLALAVMAGLDKRLSRRAASALGVLLLIGMILSHYSTSYVAVGVLMLTAALGVGLRALLAIWRRIRHQPVTGHMARDLFSIPVIMVAAITLIGWNTFATQTSNNITETLQGIVHGLPTVLSSIGSAQSPGAVTNLKDGLVPAYVTQQTERRVFPASEYYSDSLTSRYAVHETKEAISPVEARLSSTPVSRASLFNFFNSSRQIYAMLLEALLVLGAGLLSTRLVRTQLPRQYVLLGIASLAVIGAQVILPSALVNYGLLRVIQQSLIVLALPVVLALMWLLGLVRMPDTWRIRLIGAMVAVFFIILSGFVPALTGGYKASLALSNSGFYYQAYYSQQDEIAADQWLASHIPAGSRVYADEFVRRRMITYAGIFAQSTLVPSAIPTDSYVFIGDGNSRFQSVPVYYGGDLTFHTVPYAFLNAVKYPVYSSDTVTIYK